MSEAAAWDESAVELYDGTELDIPNPEVSPEMFKLVELCVQIRDLALKAPWDECGDYSTMDRMLYCLNTTRKNQLMALCHRLVSVSERVWEVPDKTYQPEQVCEHGFRARNHRYKAFGGHCCHVGQHEREVASVDNFNRFVKPYLKKPE